MYVLTAAELDAVAERHPHLLTPSFWSRFRIPLIASATAFYLVFCWWFFSIGQVISNANWGIAGNYLADWVSYEIRPEFRIDRDGALQIVYSRFDPIGHNPNPDWIVTRKDLITRTVQAPTETSTPAAPKTPASSFNFMGQAPTQQPGSASEAGTAAPAAATTEEVIVDAKVDLGRGASLDIRPDRVLITRDGTSVPLILDRANDRVSIEGAVPDWVEQRVQGGRVITYFGWSGWADISADQVRVRNRFLGWANFIFDTDSAFFGMPAGKVVETILSGERIDPAMSNLALAWNDILYNASWQHLDVWTKLLQTIVMAFVGTLFAMIVSFPLSFIAARNITRNRPTNQLVKRLFDFLRSVDMLIWALFFTRAFGPGPLAGISAIFFTDTGTLGKLYAEALENIDDKQREGVKSVGAAPVAVQRFGVLPQVLPVFASQALYFWESNTRSATIIGAVGAGGIGLKLWEAMRTNSDWENVAYMVLLILMVVFIFDTISNALRTRLIGARHH